MFISYYVEKTKLPPTKVGGLAHKCAATESRREDESPWKHSCWNRLNHDWNSFLYLEHIVIRRSFMVFYVLSYHFLRDASDGCAKVPPAPQMLSPIPFFQLGKLFLQQPWGPSLKVLDDFAWRNALGGMISADVHDPCRCCRIQWLSHAPHTPDVSTHVNAATFFLQAPCIYTWWSILCDILYHTPHGLICCNFPAYQSLPWCRNYIINHGDC